MRMPRQRQAIAAVLALALTAALAAGVYMHWLSRQTALEEAFTRLSLFHGLRKATLEDYMRTKASDVRAMSRNRRAVEALTQFREAWSELGPEPAATLRRLYIDDNPFGEGERSKLRSAGDETRYTQAHAAFHEWAQRFLEHFGYKDLYLIGSGGNILYSVGKHDDFATNLNDGPYAAGALGYVFHEAMRQEESRVTLSDFEEHGAEGGPPSAFAGSAIAGKDGKALGVLAVRFTGEPIDEILGYAAGMGESGQTYAVGNDFLMRSQSRFDREPTSIVRKVETEPAKTALNGFSGSQIARDYRGVEVLSVYAPLDFGGAPWVLLAEMEKQEVLGQVALWPALLAALVAGALVAVLGCIAVRLYYGE